MAKLIYLTLTKSTPWWLRHVGLGSGGTLSSEGPSNFVVFALIVVAAVLVWFAWGTVHHHRSADQKILIEKSHEH